MFRLLDRHTATLLFQNPYRQLQGTSCNSAKDRIGLIKSEQMSSVTNVEVLARDSGMK